MLTRRPRPLQRASSLPRLAAMRSISEARVRYAETDQMGVAYHANYLVWCEIGRTDFIRALGVTYAEMERQGVRLAVSEAQVRFHASARYDDVVRIETTLAGVRSRMVEFAYELIRVAAPGDSRGERLASARTSLISVNAEGRPVALPERFRTLLEGARSAAD
jgi:acyl-CoA thioester hydrolase